MKRIAFFLLLLPSLAFGQVSDATLTTQANVIRNETAPGGNTKTRIADMYQAIIDSKASLLGSYSNPAWITSLAWSKITTTPTTLSGYGITDAVGNTRTLTINGTTGRITSSAGAQDLSANRTWTLDLATAGTAGTYRSVTTDAYGRVTSGTNPTTLSGYGITDAWSLATGGTLTGNNTVTVGSNSLSFVTNVDAINSILIDNTNSGSNAVARLTLRNSTNRGLILQQNSSGYTGALGAANSAVINTNDAATTLFIGANGLSQMVFIPSSSSIRVQSPTLYAPSGSITASTVLDIRGTGTDNTTTAQRWATSTNVQLMRLFNGGSLLLGGTTLTNDNTILDIQSTTQGVALPRMNNTQRNAIASPYSGLFIYNNSSNALNFHNGTAWQETASRSDLGGWLTGTLSGPAVVEGGSNAIGFGLPASRASSIDLYGVDGVLDFSSGLGVTVGSTGYTTTVTGGAGMSFTTSGTGSITFSTNSVSRVSINGATGRTTFFNGNNGSLVVGTHSSDHTSPTDGTIFYNTTSNTFRFRQNGAWVGLGGATYYAPTVLDANATDANFTAVVNSIKHIPDGVATTTRTITIPTGSNGDIIELYNNEDTYTWVLDGALVYLADRTTQVTELLYNVPTVIQKVNGLWIIKN